MQCHGLAANNRGEGRQGEAASARWRAAEARKAPHHAARLHLRGKGWGAGCRHREIGLSIYI
jgi:hypothetical protein